MAVQGLGIEQELDENSVLGIDESEQPKPKVVLFHSIIITLLSERMGRWIAGG